MMTETRMSARPTVPPPLFLPPRTTWDPAMGCPCASAALCQPIRRAKDAREKVYVMHGGFTSPNPGAPDDTYIWKRYDWDQITTLAVFGPLSAELYCHAHSHGVRVTFGYKHTPWEVSARMCSPSSRVDTRQLSQQQQYIQQQMQQQSMLLCARDAFSSPALSPSTCLLYFSCAFCSLASP